MSFAASPQIQRSRSDRQVASRAMVGSALGAATWALSDIATAFFGSQTRPPSLHLIPHGPL